MKLPSEHYRHGASILAADEKGATFIEFAFTGFLFFFVILVAFESGILGFRTLAAQFLASDTARRVMLGDMTVATASAWAQNLSGNYGIPFIDGGATPNAFRVCSVNDFDPVTQRCTVESVGRPEDFVVIEIEIPVQYLLGTVRFNVRGLSIAKNEHA